MPSPLSFALRQSIRNSDKETMMRFYWSYKNLPELSALQAAEQRAAWRRAHWQAHESWQPWVVYLLCFSFPLVGWWIGALIGHEEIGTAIGFVIAAMVSGQIVFRMVRSCLTPNGSATDPK